MWPRLTKYWTVHVVSWQWLVDVERLLKMKIVFLNNEETTRSEPNVLSPRSVRNFIASSHCSSCSRIQWMCRSRLDVDLSQSLLFSCWLPVRSFLHWTVIWGTVGTILMVHCALAMQLRDVFRAQRGVFWKPFSIASVSWRRNALQ